MCCPCLLKISNILHHYFPLTAPARQNAFYLGYWKLRHAAPFCYVRVSVIYTKKRSVNVVVIFLSQVIFVSLFVFEYGIVC